MAGKWPVRGEKWEVTLTSPPIDLALNICPEIWFTFVLPQLTLYYPHSPPANPRTLFFRSFWSIFLLLNVEHGCPLGWRSHHITSCHTTPHHITLSLYITSSHHIASHHVITLQIHPTLIHLSTEARSRGLWNLWMPEHTALALQVTPLQPTVLISTFLA